MELPVGNAGGPGWRSLELGLCPMSSLGQSSSRKKSELDVHGAAWTGHVLLRSLELDMHT